MVSRMKLDPDQNCIKTNSSPLSHEVAQLPEIRQDNNTGDLRFDESSISFDNARSQKSCQAVLRLALRMKSSLTSLDIQLSSWLNRGNAGDKTQLVAQ
jgi:hypothetical protein